MNKLYIVMKILWKNNDALAYMADSNHDTKSKATKRLNELVEEHSSDKDVFIKIIEIEKES